MKFYKQFISTVGLCLFSLHASAYDINEKASINTYISQGVMYVPDNPFIGMEDVSFEVRGVGINANYQVDDKLRFSTHILSKKAGDALDGTPKINMLLADYKFFQENSMDFGIRIGRIQNHYGIYNSTRYVPNSRPGIIVPQSVYFDSTFRELMMSSDGVNLYAETFNNTGAYALNVYAGNREVEQEAFEVFVFKKKTPGDFKESSIKGLKLDYVPNSEHNLNFSYSLASFSSTLENTPFFTATQVSDANAMIADNPQLRSDYVTSFKADILVQLLSAQYGVDNWLFTTEYLRANSKNSDTSILYSDQKNQSFESEAYYLQAEYLGLRNLTVYARLDYLYTDTTDRYGKKAYADGILPVSYLGYGEGRTVGMRWHIMPELTLSAQYTRNSGTAWLPGTEGVSAKEYKEHWDWYSCRLTYEF